MSPLELKRLKLELIKVAAARNELEFRIEERLEEIGRIEEHIKVQQAREVELAGQIKDAEKPEVKA